MRKWRTELAENQRRHQEQMERIRQEEARARDEKQFLDEALGEATQWMQARTLRTYLRFLRRKIELHGVNLTDYGSSWLSRAENAVERFDPSIRWYAPKTRESGE
jgi:hypothetical protein